MTEWGYYIHNTNPIETQMDLLKRLSFKKIKIKMLMNKNNVNETFSDY